MKYVINKFVDIVSRPTAFIVVVAISMLCVMLQHWFDFMNELNVAISIFTMVTGQAILVSGRRQEIAIHLKFDSIIKALDMQNDAIGAEHRDEEELAEEKRRVESSK